MPTDFKKSGKPIALIGERVVMVVVNQISSDTLESSPVHCVGIYQGAWDQKPIMVESNNKVEI